MNTNKIDEKLINEILSYLATRPYQEVMNLIPRLQQVEKIVEEKKEEKKKVK